MQGILTSDLEQWKAFGLCWHDNLICSFMQGILTSDLEQWKAFGLCLHDNLWKEDGSPLSISLRRHPGNQTVGIKTCWTFVVPLLMLTEDYDVTQRAHYCGVAMTCATCDWNGCCPPSLPMACPTSPPVSPFPLLISYLLLLWSCSFLYIYL